MLDETLFGGAGRDTCGALVMFAMVVSFVGEFLKALLGGED